MTNLLTLKSFIKVNNFNPVIIIDYNEKENSIDIIKNSNGDYKHIGTDEIIEILEITLKNLKSI